MAEEKIDIDGIMTGIRESIRRKKEAGIYTDADVEDVASRGKVASGDVYASHIDILKRSCDVSVGCEFTSHRPFIGPLVVFAKRFLYRLLLKGGAPFWERQSALNQQSVMLMEAMSNELKDLKRWNERANDIQSGEIKALNARIDALTATVAEERVSGAEGKRLKDAG